MLSFYIFCLIVGGVFVALSSVSGMTELGTDFDAGDAELQVDADFDADAQIESEAVSAAESFAGDAAGDLASTGMGSAGLQNINFDFQGVNADLGDVDSEATLSSEAGEYEVSSQRRFNPLISFKFWTFFLCFFGLTGTVLSGLGLWSSLVGVLSASLVMGGGAGLWVAFLMHKFGSGEYDRAVSQREYLGAAAKVLVPVSNETTGKVRLRLRGRSIDMLAEPYKSSEQFDKGDECFVVDVDDGVVEVLSIEEVKQNVLSDEPTTASAV